MDKPNRLVKIVFEEMDTDEEDVKGCRVYLETASRPITEAVLIGPDRTVPEMWAAEIFDFIHAQLGGAALEGGVTAYNAPKKEDMN